MTLLELQLEKIGQETIEYLKRVLREEDKVATGNLLRSLDYKVVKDIDGLMLKIMALDYFKNVDEGRRPGSRWPPEKPIQKWIQAKHIPFKNLKSTTFLIRRSISEKGIKPLHLKNKVIDNIIRRKYELIKTAAAKDMQNYIDKIFS